MKNLLEQHHYITLMKKKNFNPRELNDAVDLLRPLLKDDLGPCYTAAYAYLLGIKQGVHNERRHRRRHIPEALTAEERKALGRIFAFDLFMSIALYPGKKYSWLREHKAFKRTLELAERLDLYPEMLIQDEKVVSYIRPLFDYVGTEVVPDELPKEEDQEGGGAAHGDNDD